VSNPYDIPHSWEEPEGLHSLLDLIREQSPTANLRRIRYAFFVAEDAHAGQSRQSGEAYITHPLAVAQIVAELRMDEDSICAALLHDVLEDCPKYTADQLQAIFGESVVHIVEGVTKLKFRQQDALTERQMQAAKSAQAAETLRKMLLAMASDMRVMVIKLADRLHNMRTLDHMAPDKRTRIANETMDIYAPLAARLGIWQVKWQLEDLAFKYLHPKEFQEITDLVAKKRDVRESELREAILLIKEKLEERGILDSEVNGRPKHLYSIWNKIVRHGFKFEEILDLLAMRIIVNSGPECYLALGIVHDLWVPIPQLFYDYIAKPKPNGYQSLHTKVVGPHGDPLEIQLRTKEMHQIAAFGVAAHWAYKEGSAAQTSTGKFTQLRQQLFDWSTDHTTSSDFLRSLSTDLFSEQVFVFTPKGDVLDLPAGSTPIDFAFRVHSSLGLTVVGSKVNGQIVPLSTVLNNGDVVELITRSNAQPSLDWLEFIKSAHARSKLRAYFRKRNKQENAARGKEAIEKELRSQGLDPREFIGEDKLNNVLKTVSDCETITDLLAKVGEGLMTVQAIVLKLRGLTAQPAAPDATIHTSKSRESDVMLVAGGVDNVMLRRGKCCEPLPGEDVIGYVTRGKGIVIHRKLCSNVLAFEQSEPERLTPLAWPTDGKVYSGQLKIQVVNRQGLLMDIITVFGESKTNVVGANIRTLANGTAEIYVTLDVRDIEHLNYLMTKISHFSDVISILRIFGRPGASK
jgi:GTP pyrophosphokinase